MTPLAAMLCEEIAKDGPISFHRFMEAALSQKAFGKEAVEVEDVE